MRSIVALDGKNLPRGAALIAIATICSVQVPIIRTTSKQFPELKGEPGYEDSDGYFCERRSLILIRDGQSWSQERDSIAHEVLHAFLHLSGLGHFLEAVVTWPKGWDDFEERFVRLAAPHFAALSLEWK